VRGLLVETWPEIANEETDSLAQQQNKAAREGPPVQS